MILKNEQTVAGTTYEVVGLVRKDQDTTTVSYITTEPECAAVISVDVATTDIVESKLGFGSSFSVNDEGVVSLVKAKAAKEETVAGRSGCNPEKSVW